MFKRRLPLLITAAFSVMVTFTFNMLLQSRFREVGASIFVISLISTVTGGFSTVSGAIWGSLSDEHRSRKPLLLLSVTLTACSFLLFLTTENQFCMLAFVGILAMFKQGIQPISMALATEYATGDIKTVSKELAFVNTSYSLGMFVGRLVLAFFLVEDNPRAAIIAFCILAWIPVISGLFVKDGNKTFQKKKSERLLHRLFPITSDWTPMKKNGLWSVYIGSFLRQFGMSGTTSAILIFMTEDLLLSTSVAVLLSSFNPLLQMFSHMLSGKFISRRGPKFSIVSGIFLSSLTPVCFFLADGVFFMIVGYICLGLAYGAFINGASTFISVNCPGERKAEFMGMLASIRSLGAMLGPVVCGIIANYSFNTMFLTMNAIMILAGILVLLKAKEDNQRMVLGR